jgi:outer membrane protein
MKKTSVLFLTTTLLCSTAVYAGDKESLFDFSDKERWQVRFRAINVDPDEDSTVTGLDAYVTADNAITPELDFSYFFTDHVAAELILATSQHDMGTDTKVDLGDVWILPPTLTFQYHFMPDAEVRPYAGAGLGYVIYYNEDPGQVNDISYENGISYALQAGVDIALDDHWAVNADIKKLYHNTDVSINGGAITADVDLDPWIFGVGLGYRF